MNGLMQDFPLTTQHILWRAKKLFPEKKIISKMPEGMHRYTYGEFVERVEKLANVLKTLGVKPGDRVATFAWNHYRHLELYYAVPCLGAVLHTLNIRLHPDQLSYIIDHAEDKLIFFDGSLETAFAPLVSKARTVEKFIRMGPGEKSDETTGENTIDALDYEELLAGADPIGEWPALEENTAAGMCYTSGTTGNPKGVVYSHRSTFLHAFVINTASAHGLSESDRTLTIVPMFHAMAWGHPYGAVMAGADQVFPGPFLDPASICTLLQQERVTFSAGVPTIWIGVLDELTANDYDLSNLRAMVGGGAAIPRFLIKNFKEKVGIDLIQGWGMTETSPVCAHATVKSSLGELSDEEAFDIKAKTGFMLPGVEFRIVDDEGKELEWDGTSYGELQVRGPWIASSYYNDARSADSFVDGWLRTGDVATVDPNGYFQIVDRTKDLVKSGGEWISSVELEKEIMAHPKVKEAAVIGVAHRRWSERPLACVVQREESLTKQEVIDFLSDKVAKWWLPDDVVFIDEVPKTSVGKFDKKVLRERFAGYRLPTDD